MIFRHEYKGGVWIDLERPSEEEIREVASEFSLDGRIERELISPSPVPMVIDGGDHALAVLHFPAHDGETEETGSQEVDIIVGARFIVTVRYEVVAPLHHLKRLFEAQELVERRGTITTDVLLEILFAHLYAAMRDHTNHLTSRLERVERDMFDGHERTTVSAISGLSRAFLHFEAALANQEEPLGRFLKARTLRSFFDDTFEERAERILAERAQVMRLVRTHRAVATEMRETNAALLEARQNEIMKTLTTITVIVLPLELIAFIFGMHLPGTPFDQDPRAFLIVIVIMLGAVALMTFFFAKKRWIF